MKQRRWAGNGSRKGRSTVSRTEGQNEALRSRAAVGQAKGRKGKGASPKREGAAVSGPGADQGTGALERRGGGARARGT